jgi:hypothetical protein
MRALFALVVLAVLAWPASARAHGQRIAYVDVDAITAETAAIHLRLSVPEPSLRITLEGCDVDLVGGTTRALERSYSATCPGALDGRAITVAGLGPVVDEAVISIRRLDGHTTTRLARPDAPSVTVTEGTSAWGQAVRFVRLGVVHIAGGADHLLLLALLVLALRRVRSVLVAETAFTVSHTLSFAATALGLVRVPAAPAEACIALSLVLLALDVPRADAPPMSARTGAMTALAFGFVHGLGFAGGLREVGVPEDAAAIAIVGFGAGVELGQLAFLALALGVVAFASRARAWPRWADVALLGGGGASAYFLLDRAVPLLAR